MADIERNVKDDYTVSWTTFRGEYFVGTLIDIDNSTAIVELSDGTIKAINIE